jgi:hypothetical protein
MFDGGAIDFKRRIPYASQNALCRVVENALGATAESAIARPAKHRWTTDYFALPEYPIREAKVRAFSQNIATRNRDMQATAQRDPPTIVALRSSSFSSFDIHATVTQGDAFKSGDAASTIQRHRDRIYGECTPRLLRDSCSANNAGGAQDGKTASPHNILTEWLNSTCGS